MYRFKLKEIEVGDTDTKGGKKSTVTDVNPETGAITWDVKDVADFTSTYKELEKAKDFLSKLEKTGKSKDDPAIDKLAAEIQELFNSFRTHIRKNYPEEYERISRLKESVNEAKAVNKDAISNMDKGNFPQELKDIIPLVSTKDMEAFLKRTGISFWEISNGRFRFPVKDKKQWHILKMMSHRFADKQYFQLTESVNEQSEQWTQWDVNNINKSLRLALKTFNNLVRNLERLEGELGKHSNKPQGNLFQGMAPDSFDYRGVQNKLNKLYNAFSNAFSIDESVNEGHGLDQVDLDYLQHIANKNPDDTKLEKIVKFLTKSNILVDKTRDLSKGKEVNEDSSEKLSIMKDENGKFIIGMAKGKYPRSKEAGPFDTQQKACEFFSEKGDILLKNLTEERLNEADINKLKIIGDIYSSCEIPVNEEEGERDVNIIAKYLPKINNKVEWGELLDKILNLEVPQLSDTTKKQALLKVIKQLKEEEVEEGEGIGYLTPNAFGKKKKNVYTSQYGYKLVPKKVKGSGLEVKQLFEKTDRNEFQGKRIAAFKEIEERLNQIYPLLSNAKDETAEYYNENPGSYAIVYSTDYIFELLDEVEAKLKQSE